jgi:hypothetical protein
LVRKKLMIKLTQIQLLSNQFYKDNSKDLTGLFLTTESVDIGSMLIISRQAYIYLKNGIIHNEFGPALISPFNKFVQYFLNGSMARADEGPLQITYAHDITWNGVEFKIEENNPITHFQYIQDGKSHNLDGPATLYTTEGLPTFEYAIQGIIYDKEQFDFHPDVIYQRAKKVVKQKMNKNFSK